MVESKAAVLYEPNENLAVATELQTVEVRDPVGEEVLVEIGAASLCHTDVSAALGENTEPYPVVMGHEGAGVVSAVGEDVEGVSPGDHVVLGRIACGRCEFCRAGRSNLCNNRRTFQNAGTLRTGEVGFSRDGQPLHHFHGVSSFTEYSLVTEEVAIPITDEIPLEEATLLGCGVFTGAGAVMNTADVEPASSVAVFGCGGVGLSGLQGAVMRSATTIIAVDPVPGKLAVAETLGATHTINPDEEDPVERIREITGGGADYAFEFVGHPAVTHQATQSVGKAGTTVLVGTAPEGEHDVPLDIRGMVLGEQNVIGSFNGSYNLSLAIPELAELVAQGKLSLSEMISGTRPLDELNQAMVDLEEGTAMRQVIIP